MNEVTKHLMSCLSEEAGEIVQDVSKSVRFGLSDRNVLNPDGPTNRERLEAELNDLVAVAELLVSAGALSAAWLDPERIAAKREKVLRFMDYAADVGALDDANNFRATLKC